MVISSEYSSDTISTKSWRLRRSNDIPLVYDYGEEMNLQTVREYCLNKKGVIEDFPFDEETLVLKVMNKMFLLINLNPPYSMNVKCDPELAAELRERYEEVTPGYHMNKVHWNTVDLEGNIPPKKIFEMIDHSYDLVVQGLKKKDKEELAKL